MIPTSTDVTIALKDELPDGAEVVAVLVHKETRAGGDALAEKGRRISGARAARRGELLIRWGEAMIEVAREMETEIGPPPATRVDDEGNDGPPAGPPQPGAP